MRVVLSAYFASCRPHLTLRPPRLRRYIHGNQLNGTIPSSLGSFTALQVLCVPSPVVLPLEALTLRAYTQMAPNKPADRHHPAEPRQSHFAEIPVRASLHGCRVWAFGCFCCLAPLTRACTHARRALFQNPPTGQLNGTIPSTLGNLTSLIELCVPPACMPPALDTTYSLHACAQNAPQQHVDRHRAVKSQRIDHADYAVRAPCTLPPAPVAHSLAPRSWLNVNQLSGTLPSSLSSLTRVTTLCVHSPAFRARPHRLHWSIDSHARHAYARDSHSSQATQRQRPVRR